MENDAFLRSLTDMDMIAIGKIRTSHGIKGYVKILTYSGETKHFFKLKNVILKNKKLEKKYIIEDIQPLGDSVILKFSGVNTPEVGKSLSNWEIRVSRELASSLSKDEFYHADLELCDLYYEEEKIGTVRSIFEGGGGELLEVEMNTGKTVLIPFKAEFIGDVLIDKRIIELKQKWILG